MNIWFLTAIGVVLVALVIFLIGSRKAAANKPPKPPRTTLRDDLKDFEQRYRALSPEDKKLLDGVVDRAVEVHAPDLKYIMEGKKLEPKPEPKLEKPKDGPPDLWT